MAGPPSRLFDYQNRHILDDLRFNAFASDGTINRPRIPPELLYAPFQDFLRNIEHPLFAQCDPRMEIPGNNPPVNFFEFIPDLLRCVAARHASEEEFTASLNVCFTSLLGVQIEGMATPRPGTQRKGLTDGGFLYQILGAVRQFILIREDKLGSGSGGGDSFVEMLGHLANIVAADPPLPVRPTILVEVVGHRLVVSLAALDENSNLCVSPAVASHSLVLQAMPSMHYAQLAALFVALRRLIVAIAADAVRMPSPLVLEGDRIGQNLVFARGDGQYEKYLRKDEPYGNDAHLWCANRALAPSFKETPLPGWRKITMSAAGTWELATTAPTNCRAQILRKVQRAVARMNEGGFVHGDVRSSNVLYRIDSASDISEPDVDILLIDFDDAGQVNQTYYSLLPFNPNIPCPPGAMPGGEVTAAHDQWRASTEANFFA